MNWFSMKKKSQKKFSGNYLCECVKEACKNKDPQDITDQLVFNYFMAVRHPIHIDDENGKRICNTNHKPFFEEVDDRILWCCYKHTKNHEPQLVKWFCSEHKMQYAGVTLAVKYGDKKC